MKHIFKSIVSKSVAFCRETQETYSSFLLQTNALVLHRLELSRCLEPKPAFVGTMSLHCLHKGRILSQGSRGEKSATVRFKLPTDVSTGPRRSNQEQNISFLRLAPPPLARSTDRVLSTKWTENVAITLQSVGNFFLARQVLFQAQQLQSDTPTRPAIGLFRHVRPTYPPPRIRSPWLAARPYAFWSLPSRSRGICSRQQCRLVCSLVSSQCRILKACAAMQAWGIEGPDIPASDQRDSRGLPERNFP